MDWVVLVIGMIFLISILVGVYRGAIKILVSLATTALTLVIVFFATPFAADLIEDKTPMDTIIQGYVMDAFEKKTNEMITEAGMTDELQQALDSGAITEEQLVEQLAGEEIPKDLQIKAIEQAELPSEFKKLLTENNNAEIYSDLGTETFVQYIAAYLSKLIIHVLAFIAVFILVTLILRAIVFALNIVSELPVIGFFNRLAGGVLGGVGALIIVWLLFIVLALLYTATSMGKEIYDVIQGNVLTSLMYEYNPIMKLALKL